MLLEFSEEIQEHVYPFVTRLRETEHLTISEAQEFLVYCHSQVEDLRNQLRQVETDESE